jgi:hypothetical protein
MTRKILSASAIVALCLTGCASSHDEPSTENGPVSSTSEAVDSCLEVVDAWDRSCYSKEYVIWNRCSRGGYVTVDIPNAPDPNCHYVNAGEFVAVYGACWSGPHGWRGAKFC